MFQDILKGKKLTCYSLSKKSGISYTTINELVRGERSIYSCSVDILVKLSSFLNMPMEEIIELSNYRVTLPAYLKKYFWDSTFDELNLIKNKNYIISRLLCKGGYDGVRFVFGAYTYEEIKDCILNSRTLDKYVANFFSDYFNLDKKDMRYYQYISKEWNR